MAQIAAEMDDPVADLETDLGGAQKVPGRDETGGDPVAEVDPLIEAMRPKAFQRRLCILERIERFGVLVFGKPPPGGKARLFFLNVSAVGQDKPAKVCCRLGAVDPAAEPRPDQRRQVSRMVEMCMCEQHSVDRVRTHGKRFAVAFSQVLEPLEQAAIHENAPSHGLDQITRSRHGPGGTQKA